VPQAQVHVSSDMMQAMRTMINRLMWRLTTISNHAQFGNGPDKLCQPRSDAYSAQQVLLNKQHIWCGGAYLDCYP